jgi:hypothetical protein
MAKAFALIFGVIYTIVGVAGFIPGIGGTLNMAPSTLLGVADINLVHNIVHLALGFWGLWAAGDELRAVSYCQIVGVVLVVLGLLGFFVPAGFGIVPLGGKDPWIHILSGVLLSYAGFVRPGAPART